MEVLLLKDWSRHKKGDVLNITDEAVLAAGKEKEVFMDVNEIEVKDAKVVKPKKK